MSRIPPSLSGGFACANAAVADIASAAAKMPVTTRFMKASLHAALPAASILLARSCRMAPTAARRAPGAAHLRFSAKRNGNMSPQQPLPRHMIDFKPDPVGVLEQDGIIARRPLVLARGADDFGVE